MDHSFWKIGTKVCCDYLRGGHDTDRLEDVWWSLQPLLLHCCTNMSGIVHVHLLSCNGCLEGSAEVFFGLYSSIGVSTYNIPSASLAMVVLPADPFFYVWNATVMSLDIDNVIVSTILNNFFLKHPFSVSCSWFLNRCGVFFGCNVAQIRTVGIASCSWWACSIHWDKGPTLTHTSLSWQLRIPRVVTTWWLAVLRAVLASQKCWLPFQ